MDITEFDKLFWSNSYTRIDDHMYFYQYKKGDSIPYKNWQYFDRDTNLIEVSNFAKLKLSGEEVERLYDSIPIKKLHGQKFILGEYKFYCYYGEYMKKDYSTKEDNELHTKFTVIVDYHGLRETIITLKSYKYVNEPNYGKSIEGYYEFALMLKDLDLSILIPIDNIKKELFGTKSMNPNSEFDITPNQYPNKGEYDYKGKIDLDFFIQKETKNGVYKPSSTIVGRLLSYDHKNFFKPTKKRLKDLGIHTVKIKNNARFDITRYYDLNGIVVNASKSTLEMYPELRKYTTNQKILAEIKASEIAAKKAEELKILSDTYSLYQHGKLILKNVRSEDIVSYFDNNYMEEYMSSVIKAGEECFKIAPELDEIWFVEFGIYSYTEMAGETFNHNDVAQINETQGNPLPKRLITMLNNIETPVFHNNLFTHEKGCTIIGAVKDENGNVTFEMADGKQNI